MAVKIRMTRTGCKNDVCYRVVAADSRSPRDGRNVENLGWYDPKRQGVNFRLKLDRIDYWTGCGAEVSDTVRNLVKQARKLPPEAVAMAATSEDPVPVATEV
jgi:small subunit ribosomal protein S16